MTTTQQQKAARRFAETWQGKGYEKGETQRFWLDLLHNIFGVDDPTKTMQFEIPVKTITKEKGADFIDGYINPTKVLIEQKGSHIDLSAKAKQSDGAELTPYQQARRYAAGLPLSMAPRWIVTCNFKEFWVYDMELPNAEPQKILLENLEKEYYRLQFLVDTRSEQIRREEEISLKAGELVGKLYDALIKEYIDPDDESLRSLNILCVRLVFCFYAEDAGLFETRTTFVDYIKSFRPEDLRRGLIDLFKALDTKLEDRDKYDLKIKPFPYVNGGLFAADDIEIPNFTQEMVDVIVNHCAPFDWSEISPTIFGAVFESTLNPDTRRKGGMHYTSIANIHKVIDPLFMDDLSAEFEAILNARTNASERRQTLLNFQRKLGSLTYLDPACGSGNFLTETYLSLRRLENKIISILNKGEKVLGFNEEFIKVTINQFYGIEINDFAVTVAKTALWIAECQMMEETERLIGQNIDFLPLKSHANIVEGNALKLDWATLGEEDPLGFLFTDKLNYYKEGEEFGGGFVVSEPEPEYGKRYKELNVVAKEVEELTEFPKAQPKPVVYDYIMGNPPFVGYSLQSKEQKEETLATYVDYNGKPYKSAGKIDYVSNWYFKAAQLVQSEPTKCAFVSTNSITQGEQVAAVWKPLFERFGIHIDFAYRTFRWDSESEQMAHVHCVVVGFSSKHSEAKPKRIFIDEKESIEASNINPYLIDAETVWIESRNKPICEVPQMSSGGKPVEGGNLIFTKEEKDEFIKKEPKAEQFFRPFLSSEDFINGHTRWCLWLLGVSPGILRSMPRVAERVEAVRKFRLESVKAATREFANYPAQFMEIKQPENEYLLIPRVSSERRKYVPIGFVQPNVIASDATSFVPNATLYHFGILTSKVHNAWMRAVCGRLKSDYRYSVSIVYNNFPWPSPTKTQKAKIEETAQAILDTRAKYPDSTLADLYDETFMPADLRKAHQTNDRAVMQAYGFDPKMTENEVVAELFGLYKELITK